MSRIVFLLFASIFVLNAAQDVIGDEIDFKSTKRQIQFNRDVRPILANHCYACHGPDKNAREADLRLDLPDSFLRPRDNNPVILPGSPSKSELIHRVNSDDPAILMPPPHTNKKLSTQQKETLARWIAEGAKHERHWAFVLPRAEHPPQISNRNWPRPRNAIDRFVQARLEQAGLTPSAPADRYTLIRRVTLDLTGLPPTPEEVESFVNDSRENAYEHLVDRLMDSTAYAERRAQDWLDLARYSDSRGYADDKPRTIWPWRDWVVRAIDRNMPFDQFTIEQIAGDMLPNATDEQRLATAFHRNAPQARGMTYPVEEYRLKGVADRVNTTGRVWLGLTMDCAECHDHKFDPVTQADYYAMFAIFNNVVHTGNGFEQGGPTMDYKPALPKQHYLILDRDKLKIKLSKTLENLPKPQKLGEGDVVGRWNEPTVVEDAEKFSLTGSLTISAKIRTEQPVANILSKYDWRGKQRSFVFGIGGEGDENSIPGHLFFWVSSKAESFDGVTVYSSRAVNDGKHHQVAVEFVAGKSVRLFVDGIEDKSARVTGSIPSSIARSNRPLAVGSGYKGSEKADAFKFKGQLKDVCLSDRPLGDILSIGAAGNEVSRLLEVINDLDSKIAREIVTAVPVMREQATPRKTFIHERGNFLAKGSVVSPRVPELFQVAKKQQPRNRLEFARWLVNGKNPLVARVVVNRYWQRYFGYGLVRSPDDFGAQGTPPTHPQLLDWLANEFVSSGWDMKHIHRLIVNSATYRQSSRILPRNLKRDPQNIWLSRLPRVRLSAEQLRDQALSISGLLVDRVGGPPVFPTQPGGYWERRVLPGVWTNSVDENRYRKTIYTYWRRMALHPSLELLNAPARENCVVRRSVSNIPTQALVLLNDPIFHEAAVAFARRLFREVQSGDTERLNRAFRLALSRPANPEEEKRFLSFLSRQRNELKDDTTAIKSLSGEYSGHADSIEVAVWTLACSVILNLDEALTRQ